MDLKKRITVPAAISCFNAVTKQPLLRESVDANGNKTMTADEPWTLYRFLAIWVATRPEWTRPLSKVIRFQAFMAKLLDVKEGSPIDIDGELWRGLRDTLDAEDFDIPHPYNLYLPPLAMAVLNATDVPEAA